MCVRVWIYLFCLFPYLMPLIARSQSMSAFERQKQKERGHQVQQRRVCSCVCVRVCVHTRASCRLVRHETGPDGHLRQSRLGLFTCFTLGHVSFVFSLATTRIMPLCQKTSCLTPLSLLHPGVCKSINLLP